jgi:hypothetical protein
LTASSQRNRNPAFTANKVVPDAGRNSRESKTPQKKDYD